MTSNTSSSEQSAAAIESSSTKNSFEKPASDKRQTPEILNTSHAGILITPNPGVDIEVLQASIASLPFVSEVSRSKFALVPFLLIRISGDETVGLSLLNDMLAGMAKIELNRYLATSAEELPAPAPALFENLQWYIRNDGSTGGKPGADAGLRTGWEYIAAAVATGKYKLPSQPLTVAVIDTGAYLWHEDLLPTLYYNFADTYNGFDDDFNGYIDDIYGVNLFPDIFTQSVSYPYDYDGHGTHVAGLIGANGDVNGAAPYSKLIKRLTVRSLGACIIGSFIKSCGTVSSISEGIGYAVSKNAKVVNGSFGGPIHSDLIKDQIVAAASHDVLFVFAAGNNGNETPIYPASYELPNIISVAATDKNDNRATFSSIWPGIDVAAPGAEIYSTYSPMLVPSLNILHSYNSGTSMAAPIVSGIAAILRALEPELTSEQVRERIISTSIPLPSLNAISQGGRVNLYSALANVVPTPLPTPDAQISWIDQEKVYVDGEKTKLPLTLTINNKSGNEKIKTIVLSSIGESSFVRVKTSQIDISNKYGNIFLKDLNGYFYNLFDWNTANKVTSKAVSGREIRVEFKVPSKKKISITIDRFQTK